MSVSTLSHRRIVHLTTGLGAFLLPTIGWRVGLLLCCLGCMLAILLVSNMKTRAWLARSDGKPGFLGLISYPVAIAVLILMYREEVVPVQAGWICLAVGDGLSPLFRDVCTKWRWPWNEAKHVVASCASFGCAGILLLIVAPPLAALAAAGAGALAESLPYAEDNLTIPFASALTCSWVLSIL
jgi:dolichol kinase